MHPIIIHNTSLSGAPSQPEVLCGHEFMTAKSQKGLTDLAVEQGACSFHAKNQLDPPTRENSLDSVRGVAKVGFYVLVFRFLKT